MADKKFDEYLAKTELDNLETDGVGVQTKKVSLYGYDTDSLTKKRLTVKEVNGEVELRVGSDSIPSAFEEQSLWLLRRLVKLMESGGTVDPQNRQRVLVDGVTSILPSSYYAAPQQWNFATNTTPISNNGTNVTFIQPVQTGPVDPRWQIIDQARLNFAQGIRTHLIFT
jgi:hypothetical protein